MDKQSGFFEVQPFTRNADEVWADRIALFFCALLGTAFLLSVGVGFVSAVRTDILDTTSLWQMLSFGRWIVFFVGTSCAVALASVWAYSKAKTPNDVLTTCLPESQLLARSAGLLSWACTLVQVQHLTKEPTIWFVEWRTNPFGMHVERLLAHNVSGRPAFKVEFDGLPQGLRLVPWSDGETAYWNHHTADAKCKALLPVVTSHVRMALAHQGAYGLVQPALT